MSDTKIVYWGRAEGKMTSYWNIRKSGYDLHHKEAFKDLNEYIDFCLGKVPNGFEILCFEHKEHYKCRFRRTTKEGTSIRKVNHNHFVEDDVAVKKKAKVVILDNNPLSVSCYMDEHPETFKKKKGVETKNE